MNSKKIPTLRSSRIRVGITLGDPSGIGPSITSQAIQKLKSLADFVVIGDKWIYDKIRNPKSEIPNCKFIDLNNINHKRFQFGKIRAEYGKASLEYLDKALGLIKEREIDCLVTAPISKEAINLAGFKYPGHTEYLAKHLGVKDFAMMLLNKELKISLATRHVALKEVSAKINRDALYKTIYLTYQALQKLFLMKKPRIVVCALNPHASDNGLIGNEENRVVKPVLAKLKKQLRFTLNLEPADVALYKTKEKKYDCAIAMYHDQALIALKLTDRQTGVNLTLGLPFVRTSPLHGTAFDIVGNQLADPSSLSAAIRLAVKCTLNLKKA